MLGASGLNAALSSEYCQEAKILFRAMTQQPDNFRKRLINRVIKRLKGSGDFDRLAGLFVFASHSNQSAIINWINPSSSLTLVGDPQFTVDKGITTSSGRYINTGLNPSNTSLISLNSATYMLGINTNVSEANPDIDTRSGVNDRVTLFSRSNVDTSLYALHGATIAGGSTTNSIGLYVMNRSSSISAGFYKNNILLVGGTPSSSMPNFNIHIGARSSGGTASNFTTKRYSIFAMGSGQVDNFFLTEVITEYLTAIGAN